MFFCVALCLATLALASAASGPPNILLVLADDLGFGDCGFTGMSDVRTPNIDALANDGLRMTRYYGQPVCSPSRAALQTGRYPMSYGLQTYVIDPAGVDYGLNLNETTVASILRQKKSYSTHAVGKWHMVRPPVGRRNWHSTGTHLPLC